MRTEKTGLLAHKSIYWININTDVEETVKNYSILPGLSWNMTKG